MDLSMLMQGKQAWDTFRRNHPKFPEFINYVKNKGITEGTEITINVSFTDGQNVKSTIKVKEEDMQLVKMLSGLMK